MKRFILIIATVISVTAGLFLPVHSASARGYADFSSGIWEKSATQVGGKLLLRLSGSFTEGVKCKTSLTRGGKSFVVTSTVRNFKTNVPVGKLKPGQYGTSIICGGDSRLALNDVAVVPKGSPTKGNCRVESGFSYDAATGYVSIGVLLTNTDVLLPSLTGNLIFNFLDASGSIFETESGRLDSIPANSNRPTGASYNLNSEPKSVQVVATCNEAGPLFNKDTQLLVPVAATSQMLDGQVEVSGTITNTWSKTIDGTSFFSDSKVRFLTRNLSGAITGGGRASLNVDPPPGVSVRWSTPVDGLTSASQATTIAATFTPVFK